VLFQQKAQEEALYEDELSWFDAHGVWHSECIQQRGYALTMTTNLQEHYGWKADDELREGPVRDEIATWNVFLTLSADPIAVFSLSY